MQWWLFNLTEVTVQWWFSVDSRIAKKYGSARVQIALYEVPVYFNIPTLQKFTFLVSSIHYNSPIGSKSVIP